MGPPNTSPSTGREGDLNSGPPFFKSRVLTTRTHFLQSTVQISTSSWKSYYFLYPDYPHMWNTGHWNDCSTPCGSGKQTRDVYCAKDEGKKVSSKYCSKTKLPIQSRKCYGKQCGKVCSIIIKCELCLQGAKYIMLIMSVHQLIGLHIY